MLLKLSVAICYSTSHARESTRARLDLFAFVAAASIITALERAEMQREVVPSSMVEKGD